MRWVPAAHREGLLTPPTAVDSFLDDLGAEVERLAAQVAALAERLGRLEAARPS